MHDVAARAYVSAFHFQRIFSSLCDVSLGEYIRRLTHADQKLLRGCKVINAAVKYGYDSPDSFPRTFHCFHSALPFRVCQQGVTLTSFAPMKNNLREDDMITGLYQPWQSVPEDCTAMLQWSISFTPRKPNACAELPSLHRLK